jgi:hypothetical protein
MGLPDNSLIRKFYSFSGNVLSALSSIVLGVYEATLNIVIVGEENLLRAKAVEKKYLLTVWHTFVDAAVFVFHSGDILIYSDHPRTQKYEKSMAHFFREIGIKTLRNRGFHVLDASLGKQSVGIINFIKKIKEGSPALIAPDGPQGPIYRAKPGAAYIASKTGSVIIPIGIGFSRKILGPNWDDFALPLPFSKVVVVVGEPMTPPVETEKHGEFTLLLEQTLDNLCFKANDMVDLVINTKK